VYLNDKIKFFSSRRKSTNEASTFKSGGKPGNAVLLGLLAFGLLALAPLARAQARAEVRSVSCSAVTMVSPGTLSCSITLTAPAPIGGLIVQLTSNSSALTVPPSILIEGSKSSAAFIATASSISAEETATVTAITGAARLGTAVALLSSTSPVQVIAKNSGKCLDVRGYSTTAGAIVQQWSCAGTENQQWLFTATADGSYEVESVNSGMSLDVNGNSSSNGASIIQYPYSGAANAKWKLEPTGSGYYTLVVESTGKCLDVTGGPSATSNGIAVQQWSCLGGTNQAWQLVSKHNVTLTWDASTSSGVAGYYVYRGSTSGGPYTKLSSLLSGTNYVDGNVAAGQTYYYATTAANSSDGESAYSNQVQTVIPTPLAELITRSLGQQ